VILDPETARRHEIGSVLAREGESRCRWRVPPEPLAKPASNLRKGETRGKLCDIGVIYDASVV
jgi:hypothetical protein